MRYLWCDRETLLIIKRSPPSSSNDPVNTANAYFTNIKHSIHIYNYTQNATNVFTRSQKHKLSCDTQKQDALKTRCCVLSIAMNIYNDAARQLHD